MNIFAKTLDSRQKGDIYWQKKLYYIAGSEARGEQKAGFMNLDIAEDVLAAYEKRRKEKPKSFPTGREFHSCPPSAAGQQHFAASIAELMCTRDYFEELLSAKENAGESVAFEIFQDGLEKVLSDIRQVLNDFFTSSGINENGAPIKDPAVIKAGRVAFRTSVQKYENGVEKRLKDYGRAIIERMAEEIGIEDISPSDFDPMDISFEKMLKDNESDAVIFEKQINAIRNTIEEARMEAAKQIMLKNMLLKELFARYYNPASDLLKRDIITNAFYEYRHLIDLKVRDLLYVREANYYYAMNLLTDEPVDDIMAQLIEEHLEETPETLDEDMPLEDIPDFRVPVEPEMETDSEDESFIENISKEIRVYLDSHPGQMDAQCLLSIVTGIQDICMVAHKARMLDIAIERFTLDKAKTESLSSKDWLNIFESWVMADTVCRVSFPIIEFVRDYKEQTILEATDELKKILPDISYTMEERKSREVMRQVIIERSGARVSR